MKADKPTLKTIKGATVAQIIGCGALAIAACLIGAYVSDHRQQTEIRDKVCENKLAEFVTDPAMPVDRSLLTGERCGPPCWQGITPGKSTRAEVTLALTRAPFVDPSSIEDGALGEILWNTQGLGRRGYIQIGKSDTVESIGYSLEVPVRVQDLIDRFGPPDYFSIDRQREYRAIECFDLFGNEVGCGVDTHCYDASYFWTDEQLWASAFTHDDRMLPKNALPLSPGDLLNSVRYESDSTIKGYLEAWSGFENVTLAPLNDQQ